MEMIMQGWMVVAYAFGVAVRANVVLFLSCLTGWLPQLLNPTQDPFVRALHWVAVAAVMVSISPLRRWMLKWIVGTPPWTASRTTTRSS
jgi:hypothetical protein